MGFHRSGCAVLVEIVYDGDEQQRLFRLFFCSSPERFGTYGVRHETLPLDNPRAILDRLYRRRFVFGSDDFDGERDAFAAKHAADGHCHV